MKQIYIQRGDKFMAEDKQAFIVLDKLPSGTYSVNFDMAKGYYLIKADNLCTEGKLYGDVTERAERILNTYDERSKATGVLLVGDKGSGKTMLARRISELAHTKFDNCVSILVNNKYYGEDFNVFLQGIDQPAVVIFDEFEKTYNMDEQEHLLTVFDGVQSSKKLFLLTCNNQYKVNDFMLNRPGRIYYKFKYNGLDKQFIIDYCTDNLKNIAETKNIIAVSRFFSSFSFDMLKALVEETNRYGESALVAATMLNIDPESDYSIEYVLHIYKNGIRMVANNGQPYESRCSNSPLRCDGEDWYIAPPSEVVHGKRKAEPYEFEQAYELQLDVNNLASVDKDGYSFIFNVEEVPGVQLAFKQRKIQTMSYGMLA